MTHPRTAIVIVNWHGSADTVRCIAACGHLQRFDGAVLVVDNGSTDGSFDHILACVRGEEQVASSSSDPHISRLEQNAEAPLPLIAAGCAETVGAIVRRDGLVARGLYVIRSPNNLGFGGGNNTGLRVALQDPTCQRFWLLNSDAVPDPASLAELESATRNMHDPMVTGSVLLNYDRPQTVQALGSKVSFYTLKTTHRHSDISIEALSDYPTLLPVGSPVGAAMMVNRSYLERHGFFDERMFLYFEELDLVSRLTDRKSAVCPRSRVYHKGGQSTGAGDSLKRRSARADYEFIKSRTILAHKLGGLTFAWSFVMANVSMMRRLVKGRMDLARQVIPAMRDGLRVCQLKPEDGA